jgi:hypothetical protein
MLCNFKSWDNFKNLQIFRTLKILEINYLDRIFAILCIKYFTSFTISEYETCKNYFLLDLAMKIRFPRQKFAPSQPQTVFPSIIPSFLIIPMMLPRCIK